MDEGSLQMYEEALQNGKEKVYDIRVMVIGQYGVGKTTLIKRLFGEDVDISERKSTEGIDVHFHCCRVSLDTWEWTRQNKEGDKYARLKRLFSILNDQAPTFRSSHEQERHSDVIYQRDTNPESDARASFDDNVTEKDMTPSSGPDTVKKIQSTSFRQAELPSMAAEKNAGTEISSVLKPEIQRNISSGSEGQDPIVELINMINENADVLEKNRIESAELTMWDFAGQYVFYTTHQMFLTSRSVYLLVTDLSQQILDPVTDDECFFDSEGIKVCKVHDLVEVWLNSIHSCAESPEAGIPPVILVGTHVDKIPEESRTEVTEGYFQQIRSILGDKPTRFHLANDDFVIDNTKCDPRLMDLRRKIVELASNQVCWGEEVPARWLYLEQAIMTLKTSGIKVVPISFVKEINQTGSVQIKTEKELDLFLRFQHEKGILIYFSAEGLKEKIVLDPKWLIDALKSLITAKMFILRNNPSIIEKWYEFQNTGRLMPELIDAVWSKDVNPDFFRHKDFILRLMEQLNIIAKPRSFSDDGEDVVMESFYIAPCMLQKAAPTEVTSPELNSEMESTPVLCCVFTTKFLPSPVFHRLLAACMAQWPVAKRRSVHLIFCGSCVFDLDHSHRLTVHSRSHVIFIRIIRIGKRMKTPVLKLCVDVRKYIDMTLSRIIGYLSRNLRFEWFVQCPVSEVDCFESMIPVSEIKETAEVMCRFHANHVIETQNVCKFWFEFEEQLAEKEVEMPISCVPTHLQHERPSEQSLSRLSFRIGREFHILGLELGITESEIQQIQRDNPRVSTQCFMILIRWTRQNPGQATFRNLKKVLLKAGSDTELLRTLGETEDMVSCLSSEVLDKKPTELELTKISGYIGKELIHLGVELGIHLARIEQIQLEFPHSVARQSVEILFEWRRNNLGQDTFRNLERAFRGAHMDVNILEQVLQT